jgi:[NiFe] hydrogenase assembly HybE family chaperone
VVDRPGAAALLAQVFREIAATRMADLPLCNRALDVEVVGLRPWRQGSAAVLITPWCMNLVWLPDSGQDWGPRVSGELCHLGFPSGDYAFLVAKECTLGTYLTCSLFSPMFDFPSMHQARAVADAVLAAVFDAGPGHHQADESGGPGAGHAGRVSRRGLLAALLPGGGPA